MLEQFLALMAQLNELNKSNPVLVTMLGAGGATAIVMSLRQIPRKIFDFLFGQMTTELTLNNAGWDGGSDQFRSFMLWYIKHSWSKWSRSLSLESQWQNRGDPLVEIGAGFGYHFFSYKGRLFWFHKRRLDSSGTSLEKMEITIKGLTRNRALFELMVQEFRYRMKTNTITVTAWEYDKWGEPVAITKRAWNTVVMERGLKESLIQDIDLFYESREWYESKGLPYKRCVLFYGPPGTGKTSTIKALASYYGRNVFTLNLSTVSDNMLQRAMGSIPEGSILLIEDFDTNKTTVARAPTLVAPAPKPASGEPEPVALAEPGKPPEGFVALSLSGLLNALDGIVPLDGSLIFLTTNAIEKIDAALLRNGRVDKRILVPFLRDPEVRDYIELMFPGTQVSVDICFSPIAGCDLMSLFADNRDDPQAFIQAIPQTTLSGLLGQALDATWASPNVWNNKVSND